MTPSELSALLVLATAASFTPGPNTTLSTALAANLGFKKSLRFTLSVPVGWGLLLSDCAGGMGAMVVAVPGVQLAIKAMGVAYLLWLALKLARSSQLAQAHAAQLQVTFWQGVMLQFLNIKAWMLALTIVAGWLAGQDDAVRRFAVILPLMMAFGWVSTLTSALMGPLLRAWPSGPDGTARRLRWFNRTMAAVLVATAGWMATF